MSRTESLDRELPRLGARLLRCTECGERDADFVVRRTAEKARKCEGATGGPGVPSALSRYNRAAREVYMSASYRRGWIRDGVLLSIGRDRGNAA